mmetsp:Transcript_14146/g.22516  ORF Transcript_14146/g.22516 Transcript_14146/m.22516 type:complete len:168 (+) Transcript_14146:73-576(+)
MWSPSNIYPSADGWVPPSWPDQNEMTAYEQAMENLPKKPLVKRVTIVSHTKAEQIMSSSFMEDNSYSLMVHPLRQNTPHSGSGDDRAYLCFVYYSLANEESLFRALQSINIDLSEGERIPVDPDSPVKAEQAIMTHVSQVVHFNCNEWEIVVDGEEPKTYSDGKYFS